MLWVPKLLRDDPDVHALSPELCSMCVPERVRMNALVDAGQLRQRRQEPSDIAIG